ncbi:MULTISPECIES: MFS transporter small subunit [Hymenobacter]
MDTSANRTTAPDASPSSTVSVAIAWLIVGIPLAWGVTQTFVKALALFK